MPIYGQKKPSKLKKHDEYLRFLSDGNFYSKKKMHNHAIDCLKRALEISPNEPTCLLMLAKSQMKINNMTESLQLVEKVLEAQPKNVHAIDLKAWVLYQLANFEESLVWYEKAHNMLPLKREYRLGIRKCEQALENAIGGSYNAKSKLKPINLLQPARADIELFTDKAKMIINDAIKQTSQEMLASKGRSNLFINRLLLGDFYDDYKFLTGLLQRGIITTQATPSGQKVRNHVKEGLNFLESRIEFWRRQEPLYRRRLYPHSQGKGEFKTKSQIESITHAYAIAILEQIDAAIEYGSFDVALEDCERAINKVKGWGDKDFDEGKMELLAQLFCFAGMAYLGMNEVRKALEYFLKDLQLSEEHDLPEAKSRSLDNIGSAYIRLEEYENGIKYWLQKVPLCENHSESAWLFHEIGRSYLELGNFVQALEYGKKSIETAKIVMDKDWMMNSYLLIGQAERAAGNDKIAVEHLRKALHYAQLAKNEKLFHVIQKLMDEIIYYDRIMTKRPQSRAFETEQILSTEAMNEDVDFDIETIIEEKECEVSSRVSSFKQPYKESKLKIPKRPAPKIIESPIELPSKSAEESSALISDDMEEVNNDENKNRTADPNTVNDPIIGDSDDDFNPINITNDDRK